jgi:hypothetical protein
VPRGESSAALFSLRRINNNNTQSNKKAQIMTLDLTNNLKSELDEAAHYCSIPPQKLASLFVEDGLRSYRDSRDELRDSIDREDS